MDVRRVIEGCPAEAAAASVFVVTALALLWPESRGWEIEAREY